MYVEKAEGGGFDRRGKGEKRRRWGHSGENLWLINELNPDITSSLSIYMYVSNYLSLSSLALYSLSLSLSLSHSLNLSQSILSFSFFSEKQVILKVGVFLK